MIKYEDAKMMVESIYGQTQGYKMLVWSSVYGDDRLSIGDNYVFCGWITLQTPKDTVTLVNYAVDSLYYARLNHDISPNNSFSNVFVISQDNKAIGDAIVTISGSLDNLSLIGWVFQINK